MVRHSGSTASTIRYGIESARYFFRYPHDLETFIGSTDYSKNILPGKVLSIAGSAVMGAAIIDLANDTGFNFSNDTREEARFRAGAVLHYADILDDLIDSYHLLPDDKADILMAVMSGDNSRLPVSVTGTESDRLFVMTRHIGKLIQEHPLLEDIFTRRYPAVESKLGGFSTIDEARTYIEEIGALVGECSVYAAESATQTDLPENIKKAAISAGRYAMYLDHAYELADDCSEGTDSLATILVEKYSVSEARKYCRQAARESALGAMIDLSPAQRVRLVSITNLLLYRSLLIKLPVDTYKLCRTGNGK